MLMLGCTLAGLAYWVTYAGSRPQLAAQRKK